MENHLTSVFYFFLALTITASSCDVADIPGMFVSDESVNIRFEQSMEWNVLHPHRQIALPSDDYVILSMSDSHLGGAENLDQFIKEGVSRNAAAVLMVGDLTTGHATDFAKLQAHLPAPDVLPSFLMAGNHDLYFDGWKAYYSRFGSSTYFFTVNTPTAADIYICLDSGGGTLGRKQLEWFENVLQNIRPDFRHCFVFTHNNLFRLRHTTSTNPNMEELYVLMDLFAIHNVDMVVTGHDHVRYAENFGRTIHITMDALQDISKNAGYLQMEVLGDKFEYSFVNL